MAEDWAANVKKYVPDADDGIIAGIVRYCGIALQKRDSSLVSFGDPAETKRVRENYLKKKLALTDSDDKLDAAIAAVGVRMKGENFRNRVTVYYLLAEQFGKLQTFAKVAKAPAAAKAPVAAKKPVGSTKAAAGAATAVGLASLAANDAKPKTAKSKPAKAAAAVAGVAGAAGAAAIGAAGAVASGAVSGAKAVGGKAAGAAVKGAKVVGETAAEAVGTVASGAVAGAKAVGEAAVDAVGAVAAGAASGAKAAGETAADAVGAVASGAKAVGESAVDAAGIAGAAVAGAAGAAAAMMGSAASAAGSGVSGAASALKGGLTDDSEEGGSGLGWLIWLLLAAVVLGVLWWLFYGKPAAPAASSVATEQSAVPAVGEAAVLPAEGTVAIPTGAGVTSETREGKPVVKVYFDTGKTDIVPAFGAAASGLKAWLDGHAGSTLAVSGYNDKTGNAAANAALSKRRAQAVKAALVTSGIADASVALVKPAEATDTKVDDAAARRVEVVVQ
jgi:outer membrane protein OmpA-like peptidoglycan-associated protein